jgi:hypothetical protein
MQGKLAVHVPLQERGTSLSANQERLNHTHRCLVPNGQVQGQGPIGCPGAQGAPRCVALDEDAHHLCPVPAARRVDGEVCGGTVPPRDDGVSTVLGEATCIGGGKLTAPLVRQGEEGSGLQ